MKHEPIASIDLMERAARTVAKWIMEHCSVEQSIAILCGTGNNGGDGLAVCRQLAKAGYSAKCFIMMDPEKGSTDFKKNLERLSKEHYVLYENNTEIEDYPIIVDAILGTGLDRPVEGKLGAILEHINALDKMRIAIDIPTGLFCDLYNNEGVKFMAHFTLTFQAPKRAFFYRESSPYIGELNVLDIGLSPSYYTHTPTDYFLIDPKLIRSFWKQRTAFEHKGDFGKALLSTGSKGKMGAAILAARSALRSGAGTLTVNIPQCGYEIMQESVPEAMCIPDSNEDVLSVCPDMHDYTAFGIGPGIGTSETTTNYLKGWIKQIEGPCVIDADALNIVSANHNLLLHLPKQSVLTPHWKEFERITGTPTDEHRIDMQLSFSNKHNCIIVLKGKYSSITTPNGQVYINPTGNPGMATGGSGDVLTGIILGLLAQGYTPEQAAVIGVYAHGLAGDIAMKNKGVTAVIPSDITVHLPHVYKQFETAH